MFGVLVIIGDSSGVFGSLNKDSEKMALVSRRRLCETFQPIICYFMYILQAV